ncbi:MAG: ATP-binding cassette domain-containing protein [Bacteroidia bacterium]
MKKIYIYQNENCIQVVELVSNQSLYLGRKGKGADIEIDSPFISAFHLQIALQEEVYITATASSNISYFYTNSIPLKPQEPYLFPQNEIIFLGKNTGIYISLQENFYPSEKTVISLLQHLNTSPYRVRLGRSTENEWILAHPTASRFHAEIQKIADNQYIIKNFSQNGTYLNGSLFYEESPLHLDDVISVGPYQFTLNSTWEDLQKASNRVTLWIKEVQTTLENGQKILDLEGCSLPFLQGEMVAIMGPSGCGKSTLLNAMNGYMPTDKDKGNIQLLGFELTLENFHYLKQFIGFVPQEDIVHGILTVEQCLHYAAKLKLPHLTEEEQKVRIAEVCNDLKITEKYITNISQKRISELSGGQKKRVAIAMELLPQPSILLLDEPTSPLDPQTIDDFLACLKQLTQAKAGKNPTTIVMVTHKPDDLAWMDKVVFMGVGGKVCYYGDTQNYQDFFQVTEIKWVYEALDNKEKASVWEKKHLEHQAKSQKNNPYFQIEKQNTPLITENRWQQTWVLAQRYLQIKRNDSLNSLLMLLQAPVIAALMCFMFEKISLAVVFMMVISVIWFGVNNAAREIVGEKAIYQRERMFNLRIVPYLCAKFSILGSFSLFQVCLFVGILSAHLSLPNTASIMLLCFILAITANVLGLGISAFSDTSEQVMSSLPIILIPQILFAGVLTSVDGVMKYFSYLTLSRWATHGIAEKIGKIPTPIICNLPQNSTNPQRITLPEHFLTDEIQLDKLSSTFWTDNLVLLGIMLLLLGAIFTLLYKKDKFRTLKSKE